MRPPVSTRRRDGGEPGAPVEDVEPRIVRDAHHRGDSQTLLVPPELYEQIFTPPPERTRNGTLVMRAVDPEDPDVTRILMQAICGLAARPRPAVPPPLPALPAQPPPLAPVVSATPVDAGVSPAVPVVPVQALAPTKPRRGRSRLALAEVLVFLVVCFSVVGLGAIAYRRGWINSEMRVGALAR